MIIKDNKEFNVLVLVKNSDECIKTMKKIYDRKHSIEEDFHCKIINYNVNNYTIKTNNNINIVINTKIPRGKKFNICFVDENISNEELNTSVYYCSDKVIPFDGKNIWEDDHGKR